MYYKDFQHVYRVPALDALPWLVHGFGTHLSGIPSELSSLATLKQIHSANIVAAVGRSGELGFGDALLEDQPGHAVAVKTADCIPILLVDERNRAVAAVHAGWRGTVQRIAARAIDAMHREFGTQPEDLHAAIGPGIGKCCYEVGPEVAEQFSVAGRAHIDLAGTNRHQLIECGVVTERVYLANLCTMCGGAQFDSFRRDREAAGRMYSFAGIRQGVE
ncbi:MAG TPA: peptidoglycan editing factor PgeF [Bryobacteraceae bacterium]|nr:peptidoglycan editing factor PgeF [Bryobacteraceae bacterium]